MSGLRPVAAGFAVRGQDAAVDGARSLLAGTVPHAILIVGPASVGKATFALDLAAALLCEAAGEDLPCRSCRACRMVVNGTHPDLHRLLPDGKGGGIRIGDPEDPEPGTVRAVVAALKLLSNEGGHRVVIADEAERLNEDAQNALLKTLEEPPQGVVILLCASDEDRLLPTVRSRCARIRLGPVGVREIETLLGERGLADAPTAARIARIAGGRPGLAIALAAAPEAVAARGEIARALLDALGATVASRLTLVRELVPLAASVAKAAGPAPAPERSPAPARRSASATTRGTPAGATPAPATPSDDVDPEDADAEEPEAAPAGKGKSSPAERRRAAITLIGIWRSVGRDLLVAARGGRALVTDPGLLEDLERVGSAVDQAALVAFLTRAERSARLIERNANPELALDVLVLTWPRIPAA